MRLELPRWLLEIVGSQEDLPVVEDQMRFVIGLAQKNVDYRTGGPFGAGVFEIESGRLVAPGVNLVVSQNCSVAHAEVLAIMAAQEKLGTFDLAANNLPALRLVSAAQPCIQCFGATWWSGVRELVIGARGEDVEKITAFNEGPLPEDWVEKLQARGPELPPVRVQRDVLREEALIPLRAYAESGATVYSPGSS